MCSARTPPIPVLSRFIVRWMSAVLDGEVVASDADERPNFAGLHGRWTHHLRAFDRLRSTARDLRPQPLVKRGMPAGLVARFHLAIRTL